MQLKARIPNEDDWGNVGDDLDAKYAYEIFFGKSDTDAKKIIEKDVGLNYIELIRFMPQPPFCFYFSIFMDVIYERKKSKDIMSDYVSYYLDVISLLISNNDKRIIEILSENIKLLKYISDNECEYNYDKKYMDSLIVKSP